MLLLLLLLLFLLLLLLAAADSGTPLPFAVIQKVQPMQQLECAHKCTF